MSASFEFLAAFEDWRQECRRDPATMDHCPFPTDGDRFERSIAHAELLKTLTAYKETASPAKDGKPDSKYGPRVDGFPGLVNNKGCGLVNAWKDWLLPAPSDLCHLPDGSCLLKIEVRLLSPFFSRDDRSFYPADNVLKRHHVFLTPCLAASGLKGLLRWAWDMSGGSAEDADLIFGKAADASGEDSRQGLLRVWPVYWEGNVGLEVINPQDRLTGAGTKPIKYEVVLPKSRGNVCLLLVNEDNAVPRLLSPFMRAFWHLVDHGGLSAKNSAGWGQVCYEQGACAIRGLLSRAQKEAGKAAEEKMARAREEQLARSARWQGLLDADGELVPFDPALFTKKRLEQLGITAVKFKKTYKNDARAAYTAIRDKGEWKTDCAAPVAVAQPETTADAPAGWLMKTASRDVFISELEAYAQELATWLK